VDLISPRGEAYGLVPHGTTAPGRWSPQQALRRMIKQLAAILPDSNPTGGRLVRNSAHLTLRLAALEQATSNAIFPGLQPGEDVAAFEAQVFADAVAGWAAAVGALLVDGRLVDLEPGAELVEGE